MTNANDSCPCCSGKAYQQCCHPFHQGALPENALQLMRSRYSAYALNLPDYIIETTHPASPCYEEDEAAWKKSIIHFSKSSLFRKLEILDFKEKERLASVTFTAYISQNRQDATMSERSYFEKLGPRWFYRAGMVAEGRALSLVKRGYLKLLSLAYAGDPILRKKAEPVTEFNDALRELADEMIETMDACGNKGLSAPQVHHSLQLFVIRPPTETKKGTLELGAPKVFINPKLISSGPEKWKAQEACLAIPTITTMIERPKEITLEYTTLYGQRKQERFSGWEARVIQHELDHLEGILFIDRSDEKEKLAIHLHNLEKRIHAKKSSS